MIPYLDKYDTPTIAHVCRVLQIIRQDCRYLLSSEETKEELDKLALVHDLVEDTELTLDDFKDYFSPKMIKSLSLLTKDKKDSYIDYLGKIIDSGDLPALLVKQADIVDHITQVKTLTPRLKDKYEKALLYLKERGVLIG